MAITIKNGAKVLYQWERGVALTVTAPCDVLRVSREEEQRSVDLFPTWSGNTGTVLIPDRMLTESGYLRAARIDKGDGEERVMERVRIIIRAAQKPENGASSQREIREWEELRIRMAALERAAREGKFDGKDGTTPHIGENGNWYIGDTDTGVNAKGDDGLTPHIGENGNWFIGETDTGVKAKGDDGLTPHIGENGNWYIGGVDTGVKATGDNGITPHIGENGNWYIGGVDTGVKARSENVSEYVQDLVTNGVYVANDPDAMLCKPVEVTNSPENPIGFRTESGIIYINGVRKKAGAVQVGMKPPETERLRAVGYRLYEETGVIRLIVWDVDIVTDGEGNEYIIPVSGYDPDFEGVVLPVRHSGVYDILIYTVTVPAGATQATQDMIRDLRGDERYCGFVQSKLEGDGGASVDIDDTLTVPGAAADAAAVGAELKNKYSAENEPPYPVKSVCGKTGAVSLTAGDVGADPSGRATGLVEEHNISGAAHNDIRLLIRGLTTRLNALADSDDTTLDQLSEIVEYIKANKTLIDSITTSKVSVADIIDNLTTSASNKPLSAKMGVELKKLIDAIEIPATLPASDVYEWAKQPTKPTYTKTEVGLGNVDNVRQYSASNPPPYPVTSVNGQTGAVSVTADGIGAASKETVDALSETIAEKVSKTGITLGLHSDGKYYIFVDGAPVGTGFELSGNSGDVFGYVDADNNVILNGNLADGSYSIKYEMEDDAGNIKTIDIGDLVLDSNVYYTVTNNLTNCTNSNSATQAISEQAYTATITADSGYELASVTVTMGGTDITSSAVGDGVINISSVTGDIVITASATETTVEITNWIEEVGYTENTRLSLSSGNTTTASGYECTGFIPAKHGDVIRIKNIDLTNENATNIVGYDSSKQPTSNTGTTLYNAFITNGTEENGVYTTTLSGTISNAFGSGTGLTYIRIGSKSITADSIVTVNQEIV